MLQIVALVCFALALLEGAMLYASYHLQLEAGNERQRLWQHIDDLESDKRALTESLCRAEGKPFIPVNRAPAQKSAGWFDGKPEIQIVMEDRIPNKMPKAYQAK